MLTPPCKDCKKRKPGCHDVCSEYLSFKSRHDKERELRHLENVSRPLYPKPVFNPYSW
jgi:hypothetical protein